MASSAMGEYIALVAREAREAAGRKPYNVASAPPGVKGVDPSTIWRFEQGEGWPQDADHLIDLYAADIEIEPIELWARALERWRADEEGGEALSPAPEDPSPEGEVDRLVEEIEGELAQGDDDDRRDAEPPPGEADARARPRPRGGGRRAR